MKVTLLTVGSRGDVQPMLALGCELAVAGHDVRMATHPRFEPLAARVGVPFARLAEGRVGAGPATPEGRRWVQSGSRYLPTWAAYLQDARTVARERLADALRACAGSDAIIASDLATLVGRQMADHFKRPLIRVNLNLPARLKGWHGAIPNALRKAIWRVARAWLNGVRKDVGLSELPTREPISELDKRGTLSLRAYSPAVGPLPLPGRDWIHVTGYWFLDQRIDPDPSPELVKFVDADSPPVCIDFGSMADADPRRTTRLAIEALERARRRGILIHGPYRKSGVRLPASMLGVDAAPHDWLFGRCAAIVHHAGAGTTAAALRAGVPSVPVPHTEDQLRWARRIHALGVASAPIRRLRLTADDLYKGVAAVTDGPGTKRSAAMLRETIKTENGTANARQIIEEYLERGSGPEMSAMADAQSSEA